MLGYKMHLGPLGIKLLRGEDQSLLFESVLLSYISKWSQLTTPVTFYRLSSGKCSYGTGWGTHDSHEGPETHGGCYCCSLRPYCSIVPPPHSTHTTQDRASWSTAGMANMWYTCYYSLHHSFQPWRTLLIHHGGLSWKVQMFLEIKFYWDAVMFVGYVLPIAALSLSL